MGYLKQATASQVRTIGPFVDDTDFKTLENALTINNTDIVISINGGADTVKTAGGATAHGAGGIYTLTWDATDTASVGELFYSVKVAGALAVFGSYVVLEEAIYDALFAASANAFAGAAGATTLTALASGSITAAVIATGAIDADAIADNAIDAGAIAADAITAAKIADGAIDANTFATGAITAAAIAADAIGASELAADAVAEIADAIWDEAQAGHVAAGSFGEIATEIADILVDTGTTLDGRIPAALVGGRIDANVGAISTDATAADNAEAFFDGTGYAGTGNVIPTVTTLTGHTAQTGDAFARLGAPAGASIAADIAAIEAQTDDIGAAGAGLTAVPWNAAWDVEVQSEVQDALDATLADSVPADGTRPSLAQAVYMMVQFLTERSVTSTTVTVKKVDGTTSLMTLTLNDATTPTSITRAT